MSKKQHCPECGSNLPENAPEGLCPKCLIKMGLEDDTAFNSWNPSIVEGPGTTIDRYRLLELLGEGGMGLVYLAEQQEPVHRKVALKIVKLGMDTMQVVARFQAEQQTLAMLDHPNIAQIFDAGTTESGRPYFVMEYVEGLPITKYCDQHKLGIDERLNLFLQVCSAIQHAHQKGVIHRDIKPSNILVAANEHAPSLKIIDFGIAKAITQPLTDKTSFTEHGQLLGTPEYMSPEQADMAYQDIDTRSDVYSLGVVLYELLAGATPFDAKALRKGGIDHIREVIRDHEPITPSARLTGLGNHAKEIALMRRTQILTLARRLRKELEWIPLKAIRKEPQQRYESVSELANDVSNYLEGAALIAGPESKMYRARKFVRKHAGSVATAALLLVVIILGLVASILMGCRAERAREQEAAARTQAEQAYAQAKQARDREATMRTKVEEALVRAENAEKLAEEKAEEYRRLLYFNRIALAESSYRDGNMERVDELLEACPEDLRNWEWNRLDYISSDQSLMTLSAHNHVVSALALSTNGKRLASGSYDKTIKVWDAESGKELMALQGHKDAVAAVSFSPDGHQIASGSSDKTIKIWDVESGAELKTFEGHGQAVRAVAFSPDGRLIVSASNDKTVKLWDVKAATELMTLRGHEHRVSCAAISPDGKYIASSDALDGTVNLWDASNGSQLRSFRGHKAGVLSIAFSPDSKRIASGGSNDNTIRVWDIESGNELLKLTGHSGFVWSVSFGPKGRCIVSASMDGMIKVWDASSGDEVLSLHGHEGFPLAVLFGVDGRRIFSGGRDKTIKIWDAVIDREKTMFVGQVGVYPLTIDPDGTRIVSTCGPNGKMVQVWDIATGAQITTLRGHTDYIISVSTSPDGKYIASASMDKTAKVWNARDGQEVMTLAGHDGGVGAAVFSPDSSQIATGSFDKTIKIWDAEDGTEMNTLRGHTDGVRSVTFSPDGERLASGGRDGTVRVWDVRTGRQVMLLSGEAQSRVQAVAFTPDGTRIVSGSGNIVKVWNARTGDSLLTLRGHQKLVYALAISPDGKRICSGGRFGVIKVWDAATGGEAITLPHPGHGLAFSPNGKTIVASVDNGIMLFESEKPLNGHKMRWTGAIAQELVNKLHQECSLYVKVIEKLKAYETLDDSVRRVALQIANARLWEDTE